MLSPATRSGTAFQMLVNRSSDSAKQQLNAFRLVDMVQITCWSSNQASERGSKGNLSDMVVGAWPAAPSISETAYLWGFLCTTTFLGPVKIERTPRENVLTGTRSQKINRSLNRHSLRPTYAEYCLETKMSNLKTGGRQQQKHQPGAVPVSDMTVHTSSPKVDKQSLEKCFVIQWVSIYKI